MRDPNRSPNETCLNGVCVCIALALYIYTAITLCIISILP